MDDLAPARQPWALDYDAKTCTIAATLAVIGDKWTLLVLREAFSGVRRFDDMQRRTGAPRQVLSSRLTRLVEQQILRRVPYREEGQRGRSEYRLTGKGIELFPILVALKSWGDAYAAGPAGPPVELTHRDCGGTVRLQLTCRAGHVLESARQVTPVRRPGARATA